MRYSETPLPDSPHPLDKTIKAFARKISRYIKKPTTDIHDLYQAGYVAALSGEGTARIYGAMIDELRKMGFNYRYVPSSRGIRELPFDDFQEELFRNDGTPESIVETYDWIDSLPPSLRKVLKHKLSHHTAEEIGELTNFSLGSVNQYSHRIRQRFLRRIEE